MSRSLEVGILSMLVLTSMIRILISLALMAMAKLHKGFQSPSIIAHSHTVRTVLCIITWTYTLVQAYVAYF